MSVGAAELLPGAGGRVELPDLDADAGERRRALAAAAVLAALSPDRVALVSLAFIVAADRRRDRRAAGRASCSACPGP